MTDESRIEEDLKGEVRRLERFMGRTTNVGCAMFPACIVAGFYVGHWLGAGIGFGGSIAVLLIAVQLDESATKRAAQRFHRTYREGTPERAIALQILSELESDAKALEKLRAAVRAGEDGIAITRRKSQATPEQQLGAPPPLMPANPAAPATKPRTSNVIPLEPNEPETATEKKDERD